MKNLNFLYKELFYFIFFCLIIFLFNGCFENDEKRPKPIPEHFLTDEQKKIIPYTGKDTILFKDTNGDTIIYIGKECITKIKEAYYTDDKDNPYAMYEVKTFELYNDKYNSTFRIELNARDSNFAFYGSFYYFNYTSSIYFSSDFSYFKKDNEDFKNDSLFNDSINIDNKTYYKVYKFFRKTNGTMQLKTVYYNSQNGIIKTEFNDNNYWTLLPR